MTARVGDSTVKTVKGFGDHLSGIAAERGRLCAGIDPHPELLDAWQLPYPADGLERFAVACVEVFDGIVAIVKPQVVFFEVCGSKGFVVLEWALAGSKDTDALSTVGVKRDDIGSTTAAYVGAWLSDGSPLAVDVLTVFPYLGFGALDPAVSLALESEHGLFMLAATSNSEGASVQKAVVSGESLAQTMVNKTAATSAYQVATGAKAGNIGVVAGATLDDAPVLSDLRGPILMPGMGAQSGIPADVDRLAGESRGLALPDISYAILSAGSDSVALWRATPEVATPFPDKG